MAPIVSVLLPVYNAEQYVAIAASSLLLQDYPEFEVIVIDDGSTDRSGDILETISRSDSRFRLIRRENRGLIATLNEALSVARGEFVARMDADDIAYPRRLSAQLAAFAADPSLAMCGTNFDMLISATGILKHATDLSTEPGDLSVLSRFFTILRHPSVMFRRSLLSDTELRYDSAYPCAEDFDLFRRIASRHSVRQLPEPLMAYRMHDGSVTIRQAKLMQLSHVRILEENLVAHYPGAAGTGFEKVIEDPSPETVRAAASLIVKLAELDATQPAEELAPYRIGTTTTFYFLYAFLNGLDRRDLVAQFLDQSDSWARIRRRERPVIRAAVRTPWLSLAATQALRQPDRIARWRKLVPPAQLIPGHHKIVDMARRFETSSLAEHHRAAATK